MLNGSSCFGGDQQLIHWMGMGRCLSPSSKLVWSISRQCRPRHWGVLTPSIKFASWYKGKRWKMHENTMYHCITSKHLDITSKTWVLTQQTNAILEWTKPPSTKQLEKVPWMKSGMLFFTITTKTKNVFLTISKQTFKNTPIPSHWLDRFPYG